jgi:hypothetical protein
VESENVKSYIAWLGDKLGYTTMEDWYKIKQANFIDTGGAGLLAKYHSRPALVLTFARALVLTLARTLVLALTLALALILA